MGNYRFRLSDMIPVAWLYKLKDMSKTKNPNTNTNKKATSSKSKSNPPKKSHLSQTTRYSYYITTQPTKENNFFNSPINPKASDTHFPENPRRLSTKRPKRRAVYKPSPKKFIASNSSVSSPLNCNCHATIHAMVESPDYFGSSSESSSEPDFQELIPSEFERDQFGGGNMPYNCRVSSSTSDTIIDMKDESFTPTVDDHDQKVDGFDMISEMELPPILTKPIRLDHEHHKANEATFRRSSSKMKEIRGKSSLTVKIVKEESIRTQNKGNQTKPYSNSGRKSSPNSTSSGIRLRGKSPRVSRKSVSSSTLSSSSSARLKSKNRRISESFAVVKSSVDPQRDFRESMMEMVVENNIRASKDLEDLLACYLSLNSNEYHHLIIKAFEQIWFDIAHIKMYQ